MLSSTQQKKRRRGKYSQAVEARRASFSPLVISVDGVLAREARYFVKRMAEKLSLKWSKPYSEVMGWVRASLSFVVLRATNLCLRGSRRKWRSGFGIDDGACLSVVLGY